MGLQPEKRHQKHGWSLGLLGRSSIPSVKLALLAQISTTFVGKPANVVDSSSHPQLSSDYLLDDPNIIKIQSSTLRINSSAVWRSIIRQCPVFWSMVKPSVRCGESTRRPDQQGCTPHAKVLSTYSTGRPDLRLTDQSLQVSSQLGTVNPGS